MTNKESEVKASMERIYNVPIGKVYSLPRTKRAMKAGKFLRAFIARHYKTDNENVKLSNMVNAYVWRHGMKKPPRRIKVKAKKVDDKIYVFTIDETDDINKFKVEKAVAEKKEIKGKEVKSKEVKGKGIKNKEVKDKEVKGKEEKGKGIKGKEVKSKEPEETKHRKTKGEKLLEAHNEV
ncbi:50S ribosomal protein L31e [Candidatus Micrarchaeota archaeon]|nr:50S ribosomal protein L31e [Candidatus Micrarchaeota archaeon]